MHHHRSRGWSVRSARCTATDSYAQHHDLEQRRRAVRATELADRIRARLAHEATLPEPLTIDEAHAGEPCRSCGRSLTGPADDAATFDRFREEHRDCQASSWSFGGGPAHCDHCCPPAPVPPELIRAALRMIADDLRHRR